MKRFVCVAGVCCLVAFISVRISGAQEPKKEYIERFPTGEHSGEARKRLHALEQERLEPGKHNEAEALLIEPRKIDASSVQQTYPIGNEHYFEVIGVDYFFESLPDRLVKDKLSAKSDTVFGPLRLAALNQLIKTDSYKNSLPRIKPQKRLPWYSWSAGNARIVFDNASGLTCKIIIHDVHELDLPSASHAEITAVAGDHLKVRVIDPGTGALIDHGILNIYRASNIPFFNLRGHSPLLIFNIAGKNSYSIDVGHYSIGH